MSDEDNIRRAGNAAAEASITLDDLAAAAKRADSAFDNRFMNIRSVTDGLNALGPVLSGLAKAFGVFEARFQTLARMSDYGAAFSFNIREMDQAALNARMTLGQLSGIVKENSQSLIMFGNDVTGGATQFTNVINSMQSAEAKFGQTLEQNARMLGYSFENLNETVLDYSQISAYSRNRERFDENARNQSMSEYLETVDELARLTGKRREDISDNMVKEARQGQNIIRARQLGERGDDYMQFLGAFRTEFGDTLGDLNADMLGPGFGQTQEMRTLQGVLSPLSNAMEQLRIAYNDPTSTDAQINRIKDNVRAQAAASMELDVMNLGVYNKVNAVGGLLSQVVTEQAAMLAQTEAYQDHVQQTEGRTLTAAQARLELMEKTRALQARGMAEAEEGTPERAFQDFVNTQINLEKSSTSLRQSAIDAAYNNLAGVMNDVSRMFGSFTSSSQESLANVIKLFDERMSTMVGGGTDVEFSQAVADAQKSAIAIGDQESVNLLRRLETNIGILNDESQSANHGEARTNIDNIVDQIKTLEAENMVIRANTVILSIEDLASLSRLPGNAEPPGTMFGSMKAYGRLFNNYGEETMQPLHGLEAVTTPAQMADIVMNAAMGGRSALAQDIASSVSSASTSTANNSTARIDSMLNTVSSRLRDVVTTVAQDNNNTSPDTVINEFMNQLPKTLKTALEEAMGSSLRPSLEQLVNIGTQHAETSVKIRKSFSGITNDYMRSA
tara:strand:+ start:2580 stop:4769 length:2190 start_codon:yes stop_codon:yes gene_type:complete